MNRESESIYARIYRVVKCIPFGRVATYGQVAELAEVPGGARQVGYALFALEDDQVPWHRVVNARGEISARAVSGSEGRQRRLLEVEGICFDARGRLSLKCARWQPAEQERVKRAPRSSRKRGG